MTILNQEKTMEAQEQIELINDTINKTKENLKSKVLPISFSGVH